MTSRCRPIEFRATLPPGGIADSMLHMEHRMDVRFDRLDDRFQGLEDKMARTFTWLVGLQVTLPLAVIGSLLSIVAILVPR